MHMFVCWRCPFRFRTPVLIQGVDDVPRVLRMNRIVLFSITLNFETTLFFQTANPYESLCTRKTKIRNILEMKFFGISTHIFHDPFLQLT